jgi:hypothetical protein
MYSIVFSKLPDITNLCIIEIYYYFPNQMHRIFGDEKISNVSLYKEM